MKRWPVYLFLLLLAACAGNSDQAKRAYLPAPATGKSANPESFNQPFGVLLGYYFSLKDDLVDEKDSSAINHAAMEMRLSADSLPIQELKSDSAGLQTMATLTQGISSELTGLIGETDMVEKRKAFQLVSDQLYELLHAVKYDRVVVYHNYCPMAFPDQGAYWLSNTPEIRNPYIPKKMISCGEVKDTIDFRQQ